MRLKPLRDRPFVTYDTLTFDSCMKAVKARVAFCVDDLLSGNGQVLVDLVFESMEDFLPDAIIRKVEPFRRLADRRVRLRALSAALAGDSVAVGWNRFVAGAQETIQATTQTCVLPAPEDRNHKSSCEASLSTSGYGSSGEAGHPDHSLQQLVYGVREAVQVGDLEVSALSEDAATLSNRLREVLRDIDCLLSRQLSLVLHHEQFQDLEGTWRGLHNLVREAGVYPRLRVRVLNTSKRELFKDLDRAIEYDQSQFFKKVCDEELGMPGGEPFGTLIADYQFDSSPDDIAMLRKVSEIVAVAKVPFVASVAPAFLYLKEWDDLNPEFNPDWFLTAPTAVTWQGLRRSEDAKFLFLLLPRTLARVRYTAGDNVTTTFEFEETLLTTGHHGGVYCNAAYALAAALVRRFRATQWFAPLHGECGEHFESPAGQVVNPAVPQQASEGGTEEMQGPPLQPEYAIDATLAARLREVGLHPIGHFTETASSCFDQVRSIWIRPAPSPVDNGTPPDLSPMPLPAFGQNDGASPELSALLCFERILHHLFCLFRDRRPIIDAPFLIEEAHAWLNEYVRPGPYEASQRTQKPLAAATVQFLGEAPGSPKFTFALSISPALGFHPPHPVIRERLYYRT
jgi:type VI secretion system protein ImpC